MSSVRDPFSRLMGRSPPRCHAMRWGPGIVSVLCLLLLAGSAAGMTTIHVRVDGNDASPGTAQQPFATLDRALQATRALSAATIVLGRGTFTAGPEIALHNGLTIRGAGAGRSIVVGSFTLTGVQNITITDLTLTSTPDDTAERRGRAIDAIDGADLRLERLHITRFREGALKLERWQRAEVVDCVIERCTYNSYKQNAQTPAQQSTAILLGDIADVRLLHVDIDTTADGGRGIGTTKQAWGPTPWADPPTLLTRLQILHCTILVDQWHAWNVPDTQTHPPQMTIELWHACVEDVEIGHNLLNNNVSLSSDRDGDKPLAERTVRMHHNRIELIPTTQTYRYAVEPYVARFVFDHNLVVRGIYPLAMWDKQGRYPDARIHHNIFYGTGDTQALINCLGAMPGLQFVNNTVYLLNRQQRPLATFGAPDQNIGQRIVNNLFVSEVEQDQPIGFVVGVSHNGFWRVPATGDHPRVGDFQLSGRGEMPHPFFAIDSRRSPAVDAGVVVPGINDQFNGRAPDLGAIEFGSRAWQVGPSRRARLDRIHHP